MIYIQLYGERIQVQGGKENAVIQKKNLVYKKDKENNYYFF